MKPNGSFRININPKFLISHKDMEAIKHIVDIAPKEAQWFHRCKKIVHNNNIYYHLYELYFPEQYCSAAEVESDPQMMYRFYKELKEEHGQEATNDIMSNLTVWSHSHHNMGVSPSGQDLKQFEENIDNAKKADQLLPQVMLIFNKKGSYHSKVWDPDLNMILENLPMVLESYDFSDIDKQAKLKFKKPKLLPKKNKKGKKTIYSKQENSWDFLEWGIENSSYDTSNYSSSNSLSGMIEQYINIGFSTFPSLHNVIKYYDRKSKVKFLETLVNEFTHQELQLFHVMLDLDTSLILELELEEEYSIEDNFEDILNDIEMHDHTEETISYILTFVKFMETSPDNAQILIQEFDSIIEDDIHLFEQEYYT